MPTTQLPLMKGLGKDKGSADYIDLLPVNFLATPKEVLGANGYMRSFPGLTKSLDVNGTSRGVQYNSAQNGVYRVLGKGLYLSGRYIGEVDGEERVSLAYSDISQAVCSIGSMKIFRYDGGEKYLTNWDGATGYAQYDIGAVRDICRARGRFAWAKDRSDTFGVTDLEDESHPDRYRALYRAESQPDGIIGIAAWRDFIVCFGSTTIEYFSLTGSSDVNSAIYISQPSLMVTKGIAGTHCKVGFADSFAFISHPATGSPSVYVIDSGRTVPIATAQIEKILRSYSATELSTGVLETVRFDAHELLLVHLPRHVLCYDASASVNGPQWTLLKSGIADDAHRAIDYMYEGNEIGVGDKTEAVTGTLSFEVTSQYGKAVEHLLYTPMFKADNARIFDFELESTTGIAQIAHRLFLSATADGVVYGKEQLVEANKPFAYDRRVLWRRIGRIRKNIGFKVRIITTSPVTLSGASVRVE